MNIYAQPGTKVEWNGNAETYGGYPHVMTLLEKGRIYTVDRVIVHSWHAEIFLVEVPGKSFNSVIFNEV